jgi:hypothetical protein
MLEEFLAVLSAHCLVEPLAVLLVSSYGFSVSFTRLASESIFAREFEVDPSFIPLCESVGPGVQICIGFCAAFY